MANERTFVHVTHEAAEKVGGIGAVLEGFFTSQSYLNTIERSIVTGPIFSHDCAAEDRLGKGGEIIYSSIDSIDKCGYGHAFAQVENYYNTPIVYGRKKYTDAKTGVTSSPEVILVDVRNIHKGPVNELKRVMFENFGVRSDLHEHNWEFEQYVRLALPVLACLRAIDAAGESTTVISHEFMGMPTALAAMSDLEHEYKTIFYAHEVATMRRIVEHYSGHDTMFYNVVEQAKKQKLYCTDVFGDQNDYFKHSLVAAARFCDTICAVGDQVVEELKFMGPEFENANIKTVYNGIPAYKIHLAEKLESKQKLCEYTQRLTGFEPDYIFTHVTRLVDSKGLWRDLQVLKELEPMLKAENKQAVFILLSTQMAKRPVQEVKRMEAEYNWPLAHREGWPDMSGGEAEFYTKIQAFNASSQNIKAIFINQFGFEHGLCGEKMPESMEFMDIRKASDVEFGLSIYEPFGIAQLEPLTFGGICVLTTVCGCAGFVRDIANHKNLQTVVLADYAKPAKSQINNIEDALSIDRQKREDIERKLSRTIAEQINQRLPRNNAEIEKLMEQGYDLASQMSWETIMRKYLLPDQIPSAIYSYS
jgi:hypothetical protein